ncbi:MULTISPECIES: RDD family protein [Bacillus]|uniref:RDD family protein n=1 Tax=Bacillus TaxID=1386 RepID=UPI000BB7F9C3|nr:MULTISPECIES: RDD family protein [Bacillus]
MHEENVNIKTPEFVSIQFEPAGLGSRASAFILDQLLIIIVYLLLFFGVFMMILGFDISNFSGTFVAIVIVITFAIQWGYFFAFEYFTGGRTIGKKIVGIRVIQENGHSITLLASAVRNLLRIIDSLPANYFLGIIMIFFHSKHKRIGDIVAGTIVVHERPGKKRKTKMDGILEDRRITKESLILDDWTIKSFKQKDWNLLKTYYERFLFLPELERDRMTRKIAEILLPKAGIDHSTKRYMQMENDLLALYLILKEEWEFEL